MRCLLVFLSHVQICARQLVRSVAPRHDAIPKPRKLLQSAARGDSHGRSSKNAPNFSDACCRLGFVFFDRTELSPGMGLKVYSKKGSFEDVKFDLQNAIIRRGLVVDFNGNVGACSSVPAPTSAARRRSTNTRSISRSALPSYRGRR